MRELGNIEQVAGDSGHQLSDFGFVIIGIGELLQMSEQILTHVRFDLCAHNVADVSHIIVGGGVNQAKH